MKLALTLIFGGVISSLIALIIIYFDRLSLARLLLPSGWAIVPDSMVVQPGHLIPDKKYEMPPGYRLVTDGKRYTFRSPSGNLGIFDYWTSIEAREVAWSVKNHIDDTADRDSRFVEVLL